MGSNSMGSKRSKKSSRKSMQSLKKHSEAEDNVIDSADEDDDLLNAERKNRASKRFK